MSASPRRSGALVAGVVLITIGLIFLLENFYRSISFWGIVSRYWPVILILIGANKLYCYLTWRETPPPVSVDAARKE